MLSRIATTLWGKFDSKDELKKFGFLASIFFLIIGTYWALRPLKDGIFASIVGINYQPWAKISSLFVVAPLVILYGKLIDAYPRQKVFYFLTSLYGALALVFCWYFYSIDLSTAVEDPTRFMGWAWYVYVESFGSLIVALFWAFTTDTTAPESAKRGFPMIALFGQLGNIFGPYFINAQYWNLDSSAPLVGVCGALMFMMAVMFYLFMSVVPKEQLEGYRAENDTAEHPTEAGFTEGLKLLLTEKYLLGIFLIITIYETIVTVFDFHLKSTARMIHTSEAALSSYLSEYAVMTGIVATLCVLLGINNIQRKLGITASLLLLPALVTVAVVALWFNPTALNIAFWIMVFSKAVNYALNQPTLKQLYIPTSKDTKYKAQAWLEMFGSRGSKAMGSSINATKGTFVKQFGSGSGLMWFLTFSSTLSLGIIGVWFLVALYVAKVYNKAIKDNTLVC